MRDLVIIGGGPAGLASAIEAYEQGCQDILVIERDRELGGILQQCIHNGFGLQIFGEELTGPEYAQRFIDKLRDYNIEYRLDTMVLSINETKEIHLTSPQKGYEIVLAKSIILAMGCRERTRGALAIPGYRPSGIFTAGAVQRYINMEGYNVGKKVFILGSGDIGLIMARRMVLEGATVIGVAEIMPYPGGLTRNIVQCLYDYDIPLYLEHTVIDVQGKDRLTGVTIARVDQNRLPIAGTEATFDCDTLLLSVGLIPENELTRSAQIKIDDRTNGPLVNNYMETSIGGIFACGNVVHVHDLVDYVTKESRIAGSYATRYIKGELDKSLTAEVTTKGAIAYTVPQKVCLNSQTYTLYFRVKTPFASATLNLNLNGQLIKSKHVKNLNPGEMEAFSFDLNLEEHKDSEIHEICLEMVAS